MSLFFGDGFQFSRWLDSLMSPPLASVESLSPRLLLLFRRDAARAKFVLAWSYTTAFWLSDGGRGGRGVLVQI